MFRRPCRRWADGVCPDKMPKRLNFAGPSASEERLGVTIRARWPKRRPPGKKWQKKCNTAHAIWQKEAKSARNELDEKTILPEPRSVKSNFLSVSVYTIIKRKKSVDAVAT